jgi:hypothetical protein
MYRSPTISSHFYLFFRSNHGAKTKCGLTVIDLIVMLCDNERIANNPDCQRRFGYCDFCVGWIMGQRIAHPMKL